MKIALTLGVLAIFSGCARNGFTEHELEQLDSAAGTYVQVIVIDGDNRQGSCPVYSLPWPNECGDVSAVMSPTQVEFVQWVVDNPIVRACAVEHEAQHLKLYRLNQDFCYEHTKECGWVPTC